MAMAMDPVDAAMDRHVRLVMGLEAGGRRLPRGSGQTQGAPPGMVSRVGRYPDGSCYVDVYYPCDEGYDDDFGSRTCYPGWCKLKGRPHQHCHRVAATLEGLLAAATVGHSVPPPPAPTR
jgi:hypothetical protein